MNVRGIVKNWLVAHGYDGLACDEDWDGCGCGLDDLVACDSSCHTCQPARLVTFDKCPNVSEDGMCPDGYTAETCSGCYRIDQEPTP